MLVDVQVRCTNARYVYSRSLCSCRRIVLNSSSRPARTCSQDKVAVCVQASEARCEQMRAALARLQSVRTRVCAENEMLKAAMVC